MKNNYDIEWDQDGEKGNGIFNGEMGKAACLKILSKVITFILSDKIIDFNMLPWSN